MFTREFLSKVRSRVLRNGAWFRVLSRDDRTFLSLTIKVVDRVRSAIVGREIVKILKKLRNALKSRFVRLMELYGLERARRISDQALSWGHTDAETWMYDFGFIKYLTAIEMNNPVGFGTLNKR